MADVGNSEEVAVDCSWYRHRHGLVRKVHSLLGISYAVIYLQEAQLLRGLEGRRESPKT